MKLLAFDTSTERMSIALGIGVGAARSVWRHEAEGGALASAALLPAIRALMAQAGIRFDELDAVVFGRGPGAFTGLRTACAVAQGIAYGVQGSARGRTGLPVLPVDTLLALAEEARLRHAPDAPALDVHTWLDARMGEVYAAAWRYAQGRWTALSPAVLAAPAQLDLPRGALLAGNVLAQPEIAARLADAGDAAGPRVACGPGADALLRLAPALLAEGAAVPAAQALPLYIRDKVAQSTAERAAARAIPSSTPSSTP